MRTVELSGKVELLNEDVRVIDIKGVRYPVVDVFVPGEGAATVFLNGTADLSKLTGFKISVYKNRLSVRPVFGAE
jgi:hypothetical protein